MEHRSRATMLKVISPVEGKNGKTFWMRIGTAFINRDRSFNVYLDAYPTSGKLQIRPLDDRDVDPSTPLFRPAEAAGGPREPAAPRDAAQDDLPF